MDEPRDKRIFHYEIGPDDTITSVDENWLSFARENDAPGLSRKAVLNKPLWKFIAGSMTQYLYSLVFERVREGNRHITIPFRCDSPDCRRFMELELFMLPKGFIQIHGRLLKHEDRDPMAILVANATRRSERFLSMCSWCKKIHIDKSWVEVEKAIEMLDLFGASRQPRLTHGVCPGCFEQIIQSLSVS